MTQHDRDTAINRLIAVAMTCKKRNTPEWMEYFAGVINNAIAACGSDDRVVWPGKWSNEFHFEIGAENLKKLEPLSVVADTAAPMTTAQMVESLDAVSQPTKQQNVELSVDPDDYPLF